MKTKQNKSFTKRIRITKNGKVLRRPMGVDHFRMSKSKKLRRSKRKTLIFKTHL